MELIFSKDRKVRLTYEETAWPGVKRVAGKVAGDLELVFGNVPELRMLPEKSDPVSLRSTDATRVFAGTIGRSDILDHLADIIPEIEQLRGGYERYGFFLRTLPGETMPTLVIAGSDKRGTIYGLFHLSELLGVSPWVYFADVLPARKDKVVLTERDELVSREPSVRYRGFFINDEWPSFGNWTFRHFGGFTAEMYDHVFELLLRLKGNYLWPAMWTSNFSCDGPGLANAELADEYGVVMSNSHHEPCLRHSEEWDLVKGEDTPYGTAWNFDRNKEGLTNYWRDGLKRNGRFENIITMGMRGERDSEVLGRTATLKENIDYLKEVITTQNQLIRETISEDLNSVPRMLAIYKEVEDYFQGDDTAEGLKSWPELDGITCMLCEDNQGNMRFLPEPAMKDRKGGWGMYYHFDYHGDPVSYEWIGSTHLPKVWEQMGQAYESGIREIWIVNVGDLKPQELPLSYFLDLAYDFDKWGTKAPNTTDLYLKQWTRQQFGDVLSAEQLADTERALDGYTWLNHIRKPEAQYPEVYHPVHYGETDAVLRYITELSERSGEIQKLLESGSEEQKKLADAYFQLVTFPVQATENQHRMILLAGQNRLYAEQGRTLANALAAQMEECYEREIRLRDAYMALGGGKWDGIMLSEHVGFWHWNEEENRYPLRHMVWAARKKRLIVTLPGQEASTMGGDWTRRPLYVTEFLKPAALQAKVLLENAGAEEVAWMAESDCTWLKIFPEEGLLIPAKGQENETAPECLGEITLLLDPQALRRAWEESGSEDRYLRTEVVLRTQGRMVRVEVLACAYTEEERADAHFVPVLPEKWQREVHPGSFRSAVPAFLPVDPGDDIGLAIEADETEALEATADGCWQVLKDLGKYNAALKAFPVCTSFTPGENAPCATYAFTLPQDGEYTLTILTAPSNPTDAGNRLRLGVKWKDGDLLIADTVPADFRSGKTSNLPWSEGVMNQIHVTNLTFRGQAGRGTVRIYAGDPGIVIERILIRSSASPWARGYIGPLPARLLQ